MTDKAKILIVDDEPNIIFTLLHFFSGKGFDVVVTNSSGIAVSSIAAHDFDVVITDFNMNPIDGFGVARYFRGIGYKGKIMLISADCTLKKTEIMDAGIDVFMEKPYEISAIHRQIKEWSEQRCAGAEHSKKKVEYIFGGSQA